MPVLTIPAAAAKPAPTAENNVAWGEMPSRSDLAADQTYFTGEEWRGTTFGGVKNAEVFQVNRMEAHGRDPEKPDVLYGDVNQDGIIALQFIPKSVIIIVNISFYDIFPSTRF